MSTTTVRARSRKPHAARVDRDVFGDIVDAPASLAELASIKAELVATKRREAELLEATREEVARTKEEAATRVAEAERRLAEMAARLATFPVPVAAPVPFAEFAEPVNTTIDHGSVFGMAGRAVRNGVAGINAGVDKIGAAACNCGERVGLACAAGLDRLERATEPLVTKGKSFFAKVAALAKKAWDHVSRPFVAAKDVAVGACRLIGTAAVGAYVAAATINPEADAQMKRGWSMAWRLATAGLVGYFTTLALPAGTWVETLVHLGTWKVVAVTTYWALTRGVKAPTAEQSTGTAVA